MPGIARRADVEHSLALERHALAGGVPLVRIGDLTVVAVDTSVGADEFLAVDDEVGPYRNHDQRR